MMMMFQLLPDFNILFYHVSFDYDLIKLLSIQYFLIYWNQYHIIILEHALCQPKDYALSFFGTRGKSLSARANIFNHLNYELLLCSNIWQLKH